MRKRVSVCVEEDDGRSGCPDLTLAVVHVMTARLGRHVLRRHAEGREVISLLAHRPEVEEHDAIDWQLVDGERQVLRWTNTKLETVTAEFVWLHRSGLIARVLRLMSQCSRPMCSILLSACSSLYNTARTMFSTSSTRLCCKCPWTSSRNSNQLLSAGGNSDYSKQDIVWTFVALMISSERWLQVSLSTVSTRFKH